MARWFRCWLGLLPALSFAGALMSFTVLRFHIPLIEPDVRISRIRLSDKTHVLRTRRLMQQYTIQVAAQLSRTPLIVQWWPRCIKLWLNAAFTFTCNAIRSP